MESYNTPLVKVDGIYAKLECTNPTGSVKDRIAKYIIDESEKRGVLKPGMKIVEATSGNTGIAISYYAAKKGYEVVLIMPSNMSEERKDIIRGLGAELVLCSEGDFAEAAAIRDEMAKDAGYFNPDQFSNPLNVECHYRTTGREIIDQLGKSAKVAGAFVAGVGTGGTLIGTGKALREKNANVRIVAVEPSESAVMSGGEAGMHCIAGIGDGFIPPIAGDGKDGIHEMIDEVVCVSSEEATEAANMIQAKHGYCVGISSGANYLAARKIAERYDNVVTVFADGYSKYCSRGLEHCQPGKCCHEKDRDGLGILENN